MKYKTEILKYNDTGMRIYLKLKKNNDVISFNYQHMLTGVIHKWIGPKNAEHGKSGVMSFSWIQNTKAIKGGLVLESDSYFFISAKDESLIKKIIEGVMKDPEMFSGIRVRDIQIVETPKFSESGRFLMGSPVLLKWKEDGRVRHVTVEDEDFEEKLNISFRNKLQNAGISDIGVSLSVDEKSNYKRTKLVTYNRVNNRVSLVPIIIKGTQEQIEFAWNVGLGNSTGIGFGSLK